MQTRYLLRSLLLLLPILAGCVSQVRLYPGPVRPDSQVALIPWDEAQSDIRIVSVDGRPVGSSRADLAVLPGQRTLEVVYTPPKAVSSYPVRVSFPAEAGHRYALSARVLQGAIDGEGVWGGKYQVFVYDFSPVHEVGRSPGPNPHRPLRSEIRGNRELD